MSLIDEKECLIVAIDFQEKLVNMLEKNICATKIAKLITAGELLNIPTIITEQYPQGLGSTVASIDTTNCNVIEKTAFSAMQQQEFKTTIENSGKKQIVIGGIETHICVHQTVTELIDAGYEVFVVKDACASRNKDEHKAGLDAMKQNGAKITCLEIVLFELLRSSKHPMFKPIQALIK